MRESSSTHVDMVLHPQQQRDEPKALLPGFHVTLICPQRMQAIDRRRLAGAAVEMLRACGVLASVTVNMQVTHETSAQDDCHLEVTI